MYWKVRLYATLLSVLILASGCQKQPSAPDASPADAAVAKACPAAGQAIPLPCQDGVAKLLEFHFYRAIGKDEVVKAPPGETFLILELEWVETPLSRHSLAPELVSGSGTVMPRAPAALAAFLAMQPEKRFGRRERHFQPGEHEALVYRVPTTAALSGLQLHFPAPCTSVTETAHFCLGKHLIQ